MCNVVYDVSRPIGILLNIHIDSIVAVYVQLAEFSLLTRKYYIKVDGRNLRLIFSYFRLLRIVLIQVSFLFVYCFVNVCFIFVFCLLNLRNEKYIL